MLTSGPVLDIKFADSEFTSLALAPPVAIDRGAVKNRDGGGGDGHLVAAVVFVINDDVEQQFTGGPGHFEVLGIVRRRPGSVADYVRLVFQLRLRGD